jgi:outer membrane protein assembly factor BamB
MYLVVEGELRRYVLPGTLSWKNSKDVGGFRELAVHSKWTIVSRSEYQGKREIVGLNRSTGVVEWRLPATVGAGLLVDGNILYASRAEGEVEAIDLTDRHTIWKAKLEKGEILEEAVLSGGLLLLSTEKSILHAFNTKTGKVAWSRPEFYTFGGSIDLCQGVIMNENDDGVFGLDAATGKPKWKLAEKYIGEVTPTPIGFVAQTEDRFFAIATTNGKTIWSHKLVKSDSSSSADGVRMFNGRILLERSGELTLYNLDGTIAWSAKPADYPGSPIWSDGRTLVVHTFGTFAMESGVYPPLPTTPAARAAAAELLVKDFANLSSGEIERLESLGDDAFSSVLQGYLNYSAQEDQKRKEDEYYNSMTAYELGHVLQNISTSRQAAELATAYDSLGEKDSARRLIGQLYANFGEPASKVVKFIDLLNATPPEQWDRNDAASTALDALAASSEPKAVAFMMGVLKNKALSNSARETAYQNLVRSGGEAGRAAVWDERFKAVLPLESLEARMHLDKIGSKKDRRAETILLGQFTDTSGHTWGLVTNGVLANRNDLWVLELVGDKWTRPVFTGIAAKASDGPFQKKLGEGLDGKTGAELASGAWKTVLVGRASLSIDSDRDGLTDLVEKRLGTKPDVADTDGDGRSDAVDAFPTVAPRPLTDEEEMLAAVYEAHYHFDMPVGPATLSMEGHKPFEMPGRQGPVLWDEAGPIVQLHEQYENGIALIGLSVSKDPRTPEEVRDGIYSVKISTYYGGLNGTGYLFHVRKFGDHWFVLDGRMEYIS